MQSSSCRSIAELQDALSASNGTTPIQAVLKRTLRGSYAPYEQQDSVKRYSNLLERFQHSYGHSAVRIARAPGRINLIGEHTDYNGCPVLPMAINRDIVAAFHPNQSGEIAVASTDPQHEERRFALSSEIPPYSTGDWGNYVKAGVQGIIGRYAEQDMPAQRFCGIDMLVDGTLPPAVGMSSSSALVVVSALAFLAANDLTLPKPELAHLLARAEHYVGTQGGGMDQAASLLGEAGKAVRIDFSPFKITPCSMPPGYSIIVTNSLVHSSKTGAALLEYNRRVVECRLAVTLLKHALSAAKQPRPSSSALQLIGDFSEENLGLSAAEILNFALNQLRIEPYSLQDIADCLGSSSAEVKDVYCRKRDGSFFEEPPEGFKLAQRFRHVFSEWKRVEHSIAEFETNNMTKFGEYMYASHASCRDDYEISCAELDRLVEIAQASGAIGARLTGAGFGGCTITLVRDSDAQQVAAAFEREYYRGYFDGEEPDLEKVIFVCQPADGAAVVI